MEKEFKKMNEFKDALRNLMVSLDKLNEKGVINTLCIQSSGINALNRYKYVSFKIPEKK